MTETLAQVGEETLIALVRTAFASERNLEVPIGDDGAVLVLDAGPQVLVADAMMEGIHFTTALCPPRSVGQKLVSVNVSDIAAMGAKPDAGLLTMSLPAELPLQWVKELIEGVGAAARRYDLAIVGGDITGSPGPISLSLSLIGTLQGPKPLCRTEAKPGDRLYLAGTLGAAALGHRMLKEADQSDPVAIEAFLCPTARIEEAVLLSRWNQCNALMDVSDGLLPDAERMAKASAVRLDIDLAKLPIHGTANEAMALYGGEDYALLFSCRESPPIHAQEIGAVRAGTPGVFWLREGQSTKPPRAKAFSHF